MNILFLLSFDLSEIGSLILELISLLLAIDQGLWERIEAFDVKYRLISPARFHTSWDNCKRNKQKWTATIIYNKETSDIDLATTCYKKISLKIPPTKQTKQSLKCLTIKPLWCLHCVKTAFLFTALQGRIQGEGAGGAHPTPWGDLRFSNATGILQKKKLCGLLVLK